MATYKHKLSKRTHKNKIDTKRTRKNVINKSKMIGGGQGIPRGFNPTHWSRQTIKPSRSPPPPPPSTYNSLSRLGRRTGSQPVSSAKMLSNLRQKPNLTAANEQLMRQLSILTTGNIPPPDKPY